MNKPIYLKKIQSSINGFKGKFIDDKREKVKEYKLMEVTKILKKVGN